MSNEQFSCSGGLFYPDHFCKRPKGIYHAVCRVIVSQPIEKQAALYKSIILCGDTPLLKSFSARLSTERNIFMKVRTTVKVIAHMGGANEMETNEGHNI